MTTKTHLIMYFNPVGETVKTVNKRSIGCSCNYVPNNDAFIDKRDPAVEKCLQEQASDFKYPAAA